MNNIFIANLGKYNEGELVGDWFELGQDEEDLNTFLKENVGINDEYEEWFIADTNFDDFSMEIHEYDDIFELNKMFIRYKQLSTWEQELIQAIIELGSYGDLIDEVIDNMNNYYLYSNIENEFDIGYALVNEWGYYDTSNLGNLASYIDYESLGRDFILSGGGTFTSKGLLINC